MSLSPPVAAPRPDKSRTTLIILVILAVFVLLLGLGIAALVKGVSGTANDAKPQAEKFLTAIEKRDYKSAEQQLSPQAQGVTKPDQIGDIVALLEKHRGKIIGHSGPTGYFVGNYNGVTQATFTYNVTFAKGETTARIVLVKQRNEWRVHSFNYQL